MRRTTTAAVLAMLMALALALAGCGGGAQEGQKPRAAGTGEVPEVTWAMPGAPRTMDIAHGLDTRTNLAIFAAFEGLLRMDKDGKLAPHIATSWTNPDPLTYVYTLRDDVTFWNGEKLTAEDVAFSLRRQIVPEEAAETMLYLSAVQEVSATGPTEVTVTLKTPDPRFQYMPALVWTISQKSYVEAAGADYGTPAKPGMGTGPFKVTSFSPADGVTFERYDGYWGQRPSVVKLNYRPIPDPEAMRLAMLAGEVDGTLGVPLIDMRKWERTDGVSLYFTKSLAMNYLSFDVTTAPFDDVRVRRAIAYAVDRQGLLDPLFGGRADLAVSTVSTTQLAALAGEQKATELNTSMPEFPFDLEKAKAELAQSAHPNGFTVEVPYTTTQAWARLTLENLAQNLAQIGITLVPKAMPDQQWVANLFAHQNLGMQIMRAAGGTPDPAEMLPMMFSAASAAPNGFNTANFTTPELEAKLVELGETSDPAARTERVAEIMRLAAAELPYVPLFEEQLSIAVRNELVIDPEPSTWLGGGWASQLKPAA